MARTDIANRITQLVRKSATGHLSYYQISAGLADTGIDGNHLLHILNDMIRAGVLAYVVVPNEGVAYEVAA